MTARRVANLRAFARVYGALRWFHPSDAGAAIDWDRFACDGVRRVLDAPDPRALRAALQALIAPVAPTVQLAIGDEAFAPAGAPGDRPGLEVVSWQHEGYGDTTIRSVYASKRRHRDRMVLESGRPRAALWQSVDAAPFRGARVRLHGKLRAARHGAARLWLRVDGASGRGFHDTMRERAITSTTWQDAELIGAVDPDATRIAFGTIVTGSGVAWYDDLELSVEQADGSWKPVAIQDPGFEGSDLFTAWAPGTGEAMSSPLRGWNATLDRDHPASGRASLRVEPAAELLTRELFDESPAPGEVFDVDLGDGIRARVPLTLASENGRTIGDDPEAARRSQAGPAAPATAGLDAICGIADVIVVWNVLEHFWPYWDVVATDWNAALDRALGEALANRTIDDHVATLSRLSAAAPDGHAETMCNGATPRAYLPFTVESIGGQLVVTATSIAAVHRGDAVVAVDGRPASELLAAGIERQSGSRQYRLSAACLELGSGPPGSTAAVRVRRGGGDLEVTATRGDRIPPQFAHPPIERLDDGVYYVDLGRAGMADITAILDRLATAPGVVFDLRDYPNGNDDILSYLLTAPANFSEGMAIPRVIRPGHRPGSVASWVTSQGEIPVLTPHIAGRVAFVTGPRAISYAESVMSIVEHHHLGEIVGAATAGTNGNIAEITTPTGCRTLFTALRVQKRDGSPFHLVGVLPTIPVQPTRAGVLAGRDEVLDRALDYVRTGAR